MIIGADSLLDLHMWKDFKKTYYYGGFCRS